MEREHGQQRPLLPARHLDLLAALAHLERPEKTDLHLRVVTPATTGSEPARERPVRAVRGPRSVGCMNTSRITTFAALLATILLPGAATGSSSGEAAPDAAFAQRSYAPGETASLAVWYGRAQTVRIERVGLRPARSAGRSADDEVPGDRRRPACLRPDRRLAERPLRRPRERSRWHRPGAVRRPPEDHSGDHRIAVVLPTNTWQAYNRRDVDGNGIGDTWYADSSVPSVDLTRPYLDGGVPPKFRGYDRGFLRWLAQRSIEADFLADDDFERVATGDRLARLYDLIVFPGHEEYVTTHAYDVIERYRDLGGNLMFLSANNFFYRVERRGARLYRTGRWRASAGRRRSSVCSTSTGTRTAIRNLPYVVTAHGSWVFRGTGLREGDRFGKYGIEIDARTSRSPKGIRVLARIHNAFGPGKSAEMTYYETGRGAKVFAAGVINFGGSALWPHRRGCSTTSGGGSRRPSRGSPVASQSLGCDSHDASRGGARRRGRSWAAGGDARGPRRRLQFHSPPGPVGGRRARADSLRSHRGGAGESCARPGGLGTRSSRRCTGGRTRGRCRPGTARASGMGGRALRTRASRAG